jgi:hypothetical protein
LYAVAESDDLVVAGIRAQAIPVHDIHSAGTHGRATAYGGLNT